jgi:hypothetical protein
MDLEIINNIKYFNSRNLIVNFSHHFEGVKKVRDIIKIKNLKESDYVFMYYKKGIQQISNITYCKADLWITENWVQENLINNIIYPERPEELILDEHEKFKSIDGNVYNIRVYGKRNINEIFINVKDIARELKYERLCEYIEDKCHTSYIEGEDYKYFGAPNYAQGGKKSGKNNDEITKNNDEYFTAPNPGGAGKKSGKNNAEITKNNDGKLYLTYEGFLKMIYITNNHEAKGLRNWLSNIIFTLQMGKREDKVKVITKSMCLNHDEARRFFLISSTPISCLYLFVLSSISENEKTKFICKFGYTNNLNKRMGEHQKTYGDKFNETIHLQHFVNINSMYLQEAERKLYEFFKDDKYILDNEKELILIDKTKYKACKKLYKKIGEDYDVKETRLVHEMELMKKDNENEILKKDNEILKKDNEIMKKDNEIMKKDHEIEILKLKLSMK